MRGAPFYLLQISNKFRRKRNNGDKKDLGNGGTFRDVERNKSMILKYNYDLILRSWMDNTGDRLNIVLFCKRPLRGNF